jgi:hypothetical protein
MNTIAPDAEKLHELDEDERHAWKDYHRQLQGLTGKEYEQAEPESWELLQEELRHVERQRILVKAGADS